MSEQLSEELQIQLEKVIEPELKHNIELVQQELKAIADDFRFVDPVSNAETHDIEDDIINLIEQIKDCLLNGDIQSSTEFTAKLRAAISTRNRLCKNNT